MLNFPSYFSLSNAQSSISSAMTRCSLIGKQLNNKIAILAVIVLGLLATCLTIYAIKNKNRIFGSVKPLIPTPPTPLDDQEPPISLPSKNSLEIMKETPSPLPQTLSETIVPFLERPRFKVLEESRQKAILAEQEKGRKEQEQYEQHERKLQEGAALFEQKYLDSKSHPSAAPLTPKSIPTPPITPVPVTVAEPMSEPTPEFNPFSDETATKTPQEEVAPEAVVEDDEIIEIEPAIPEVVEEIEPEIADDRLSPAQVAFIVDRIFKEVMGQTEAAASAATPLFEITEDKTSTEEKNYSLPLILNYENETGERKSIPMKKVLESINWQNPLANRGSSAELNEKCAKFVAEAAPNLHGMGASLIGPVPGNQKEHPWIHRYSFINYMTLNPFLRTGRIVLDVSAHPFKLHIQNIDQYAKALFFTSLATAQELTSLPEAEKEQVVYRKVKFDREYIEKTFVAGETYVESAFCSTSTESNIFDNNNNVCFTIKTHTGKSIKEFAALPEEEEVLLPAGQKFKVEKIEPRLNLFGKCKGEPYYWDITLVAV